jgi:hypothetical protein
MPIINLTPHDVSMLVQGEVVRTYPASGIVARCAVTATPIGEVEGFAIKQSVYGEVQNLPPYEVGVYYLVAGLVRSALPHRFDLLSPGGQVRDKDNPSVIVGCTHFDSN